jgi:hypothetical protein
VAYRKTGLEWEILGDLGLRLHHKEEAKEAFQRALDTPRYSIKPWAKLLDMYAEEGDLTRTLQVAIRVAAYQHGEYSELAVCSHHDVICDEANWGSRSTPHRSRVCFTNWNRCTGMLRYGTRC